LIKTLAEFIAPEIIAHIDVTAVQKAHLHYPCPSLNQLRH
jgi:hypothetical protein